MGRLERKHRGKGNFCSQGINRGKHLVDLNKEKQAHVSCFNFLRARARAGGGVGWGGDPEGKEKLNSNVPEPTTATRLESLSKIGSWSEIGYSLA